MNRRRHGLLFTLSVGAVLALIAVNLFSMRELREQQQEMERENYRIQLDEFASQLRFEIISPLLPLWRLDIDELGGDAPSGPFPPSADSLLLAASASGLYSGIYFTPDNADPCTDAGVRVFRFEADTVTRFERIEPEEVPQAVCDAILNSKTRARVLVEDTDGYRWNAKISYDTHRSHTLAFLDLQNRTVPGHITFLFDERALVHGFIAPRLQERFGEEAESRMVVWLRDWTARSVLASTHPGIAYDPERHPIDIRQGFPDFLDYWNLHASFLPAGDPASAGAGLFARNLLVLGFSGLVLVIGLVTLFVTLSRERELSQRQSEFLANVTHELKTPLAVMQAAGENISDGRVKDPARLSSYGDHIHRESLRLRAMIDKLLDVARSESGRIESRPVRIDTGRFIADYAEAYRDVARSAGFELRLELSNGLPDLQADPSHLRTILDNLLDNATKYSGTSRTVVLRAAPADGRVRIEVQDYGVGIERRSLKKVFEKFYRAENPMTAQTKGHGLGLAIVKRLVERHKGSIQVRSSLGRGTTFVVEFPAVPTSPAPAATPSAVERPTSRQAERLPDRVASLAPSPP